MIFTGAWATVGVALGLLLIRLNDLPESVPVFVSVLGTPTRWAPTSLVMVARVPLMGAGQLMAVTALAYGAVSSHPQTPNTHMRISQASPSWARFFQWMAIAIAAKTFVESVMLAGTGTAWGEATSLWLQILTIMIVASFLVFAGASWRRRVLSDVPQLPGTATRITLTTGLAVWLAWCHDPVLVVTPPAPLRATPTA